MHADPTVSSVAAEVVSPPGTPFEIGDVVAGHYVIRRMLGRGGMSDVYEADDTLLRRRVAIKVIGDAALGPTLLLHEARALAAVRHAGLPAVYGIEMHRGWALLVLERLYGVTLEDRLLGRAPPSLDESLTILTALADVLAVVHAAGVAHRDLKPANVMLCPGERVVLLDFGIMIPEVAADELTRCGTPRYLAPEIIRGDVQPGRVHLVDIYAFGAMAFEMLAGRPPFEGRTIVALLEQHLIAPLPSLRERRPELPPRLATLVESALAKDPGERPPAMEAIAWELRSIARRLESDRRAARKSGAFARVDVAPSTPETSGNE